MIRQDREPKGHRKQRQQQHAPAGLRSQFTREGLNPRTRHQRHRNQQRSQGEFDQVAYAEANRILRRHEGPFSQR